MTESISPFAPLSELLRAPLRKEDLEFQVDDANFLMEFEKAWGCFLRENPDLVPKGTREERILELQKDAKREEEGKLKILKEMEQQVEFFKASCEALEELYSGPCSVERELTWCFSNPANIDACSSFQTELKNATTSTRKNASGD